MTRKELLEKVEETAKRLVGVTFKTNPLNSVKGYKRAPKGNLENLLFYLESYEKGEG